MRRSQRLSAALKRGGFSLHAYVGRKLHVGFAGQCLIIAGAAALVVLFAAAVDHSFFLPGRSIGLFEHPGIWAFIGVQAILPLSLRSSLLELMRARRNLVAVGALPGTSAAGIITPLVRYLRLESGGSRLVATALYGVGLVAFVWNTYQNQLPGIVVPYDFWDSKSHFWGFWTTRVYKLYLFVWLLPYIAFLHVAVLRVALGIVRSARMAGSLRLLPYHPDGVGGLGFLPELVTRPLVVAVILGTLPTAAAFEVHRAADVTPLMGLAVLLLATAVAYFVPILALRADIVATKETMVKKLRWMQQANFTRIFENKKLDPDAVKSSSETIEYFEKLCTAIDEVSNYPHLKRLIGVATLAMTPAVGSMLGKLYDSFSPVIQPWLAKH